MIRQDLDLLILQADKECGSLNLKRHSENVARYSVLIFENLPDYEKKMWSGVDHAQIYDAGMFHDIGKAFMTKFRSGLLEKEKFDALDRFNIQEHVTAGVVILQALIGTKTDYLEADTESFRLILDACLYHHERTDGSGYLKTTHESIPRIGELVAVADCFSAGIEKRIYSDDKSKQEMLKELKEMPLNQVYVNALERGLNKSVRFNNGLIN